MKRKPASLPQVASFECACGTIHNSRDGNIPVGWSQRAGSVFCTDCTRQGIASREIRRAAPADKVRMRGEVMALLQQGADLMPKRSPERAAWVRRVNTLIAEQLRAA